MSYNTLYIEHESRVATITLNRPDKRNAISYELIEDLLSALDEVANSPALVLILTGAGQSILLRHGLGQSESARGPFYRNRA